MNIVLVGLVAAWLGPALQRIYGDIPDFSYLCVVTAVGLVFAADVQVSGALYRVFDKVVPYALIVNYTQSFARFALSALVLASAVFLLLEMGQPFTGWVAVSSEPFRDALVHISQ